MNFKKEIVLNNNNLLMEYNSKYAINRDARKWEPHNFRLETTTAWNFPERGSWATHNGKYRGNWSPYIPRNIILRYSEPNDIILDQFLGSGTTLIESALLKRNGIGIDINQEAISLSEKNLNFNKNNKNKTKLYVGDARKLRKIYNESIDLICSHPPYANIIRYSDDIAGDLSHSNIEEFLIEMKKVASESYRVLGKGKFCAILMGDIRRNKNIIPLGFRTMQTFLEEGFILKEIIIKQQHNCKSTSYWTERSIKHNFLLIAHEYLFIFYKSL